MTASASSWLRMAGTRKVVSGMGVGWVCSAEGSFVAHQGRADLLHVSSCGYWIPMIRRGSAPA